MFATDALAHHAVFPRGPREYVTERLRLRYFPAMAARVPELREHFFYRRGFLSRRTAAFDLGVCGALVALLLRSPLPLVALGPYARQLRRRPAVAAVDVAADVVGMAALVRGSVRYRSPVV